MTLPVWIIGTALAMTGCLEAQQLDAEGAGEVLGLVIEAPGTPALTGEPTSGTEEAVLTGSLRASYELMELGPASAGQRWKISASGATAGSLVVALFDADMSLLARAPASAGQLQLVVRTDTSRLILGVSTGSGGGGTYRFELQRADGAIPAAQPQTVWLNFGGAAGIQVHRRAGLSFSSFDAADLGSAYVGATQRIKDAIVAAMRADYADYGVTITTSDEAPQPPAGAARMHFGGADDKLLGLADAVDEYNAVSADNAIVFIEGFSVYAGMELTPEELAMMIANVGSHELGHLLGLYHTRNPSDVMDTTGNAWELAGEQAFSVAQLEASVFPVGTSDSPRLLMQSVGPAAKDQAQRSRQGAAKLSAARWTALLIEGDLPHACGTCAALDD